MLYSTNCLSRAAPCAAGPVRVAEVPGTAMGSLLGVRSRSCDDVCCGCGPNRVAILQGNSTSPQVISQQSLDSRSQLKHVQIVGNAQPASLGIVHYEWSLLAGKARQDPLA